MSVNLAQVILTGCVRVYRWTVSPLLSVLCGPFSGCRFEPTCSQYAIEAVEKHGAMVGSWLSLRRLCRCHPWGDCGVDPVPVNGCANNSPETF